MRTFPGATNTLAHSIHIAGWLSTGLTVFALGNAVAADSNEQAVTLDAVTVSATRREEPLQKVPVAVSVVDGEQLERDGRNSVSSIVQQVPSLNFRTGASNKDTSLFVRGVGTISTSPGVEPTVATVIDGVVYARPGQTTLDLLDLDRIEVLRGPQGTLFGKNASAGVMNIISWAPSAETQGYIDQSYFSGNESRTRFGLGGSLIPDTLTGSVNLTLSSAGFITFSFLARRDLRSSVTTLGDKSNVSIMDIFSIACNANSPAGCAARANSDGIVFQFAPDGDANNGSDVNGNHATGSLDPFSLNLTAGTNDPATSRAFTNAFTQFSLTSNFALPAGSYTLNFSKSTRTDIVVIEQVPEPDTLLLLGIGLAALATTRRRT